jgi:hypothetical protein
LDIVTNACEEMKRNEIAYGGQLWMQQDRHMAIANPVILGDPKSREAAVLSAVCEAVEWTHALEFPDAEEKRMGQRVIIYPRELSGLSQVISTGNPIVDDATEDHSALYERILIKSEEFDRRPLFLSEDDPQIVNHSVWSTKIQGWMITASRIATGSRPRVLEDGPDVMNSDDEDSKVEEHGEELKGCFANGCSSLEESRMSEQLAQVVRSSASFATALPAPQSSASESNAKPSYPIPDSDEFAPLVEIPSRFSTPPRVDSPVEPWMSEKEEKTALTAQRVMNEQRVAQQFGTQPPTEFLSDDSPDSSPPTTQRSLKMLQKTAVQYDIPTSPSPAYDVQPPAKAAPLTIVTAQPITKEDLSPAFQAAIALQDPTSALTALSDDQVQVKVSRSKRVVVPNATVQAVRTHEEQKGKGQESPVQRDPHKMTTRLQEARRQLGPNPLSPPVSPTGDRSRAGGFGGGTGSGKTQGRGHARPPSKPGS